MNDYVSAATPGAVLPGLALALAVGLLLGVERGWSLRDEESGGRVAGIRTFALLGLLGGVAGLIARSGGWPLSVILVGGAIAALMVGYAADIRRDNNVSATSALAGVVALALGATATIGFMAIASAGAGAAVILLASREPLHRIIKATSDTDIKALLRLVLVVFIVLPLLPDDHMGPFGALNPYRLWTVVVITGSISFVGYILVRWLGERRGTLVTAAVGALVSSTAVTVEAARRAREGATAPGHQVGVAIASTIMLGRSLFLVAMLAPFAFAPFAQMVLPGLLVSALASGLLLYLGRAQTRKVPAGRIKPPGLGLAFLFATTVAILAVGSAWAQSLWGGDSGAILIAIGGLADIDAAIAAVGALPPGSLEVPVAALALAGPTFFNTLFKLGLFVFMAGWRRAIGGGVALASVAVALLIPILLALT
ncbi:MAG TPA: DUF4010 domain-containing protein [Allosphingosinicella sp.]|nr:DUF4010 domain-containing protein [Allosphingosinicella sp.]